MIALIALAVVFGLSSVWWISRPLRRSSAALRDTRLEELEIVRDRLLVQLRELEQEQNDHGVDADVARSEDLRISAELADVLRQIENIPGAAANSTTTPLTRQSVVGITVAIALVVLVVGGGLYAWRNAQSLQGIALAARNGVPGGSLPPMVLEMVARLEKRLAEHPDDGQGWARLGRSYVVMKRLDKARDAYARAFQLMPDNVEILSDYAWIVFSTNPGNTTGLVFDLYSRLARLDPNHVDALWFLGMAAFQADDPARALSIWSKLEKQVRPGSPESAELARVMRAARDKVSARRPAR